MRNDFFSIPAADDTYESPAFNNINTAEGFSNSVSFEFYDDAALTIPSTGVTGTITVNAKPSLNGYWQNVPDSLNPSTVDAATPYLIEFEGPVYMLQIITNSLANTDFVKIIYDFSKSA